jgi:hypothetical protein
MQPLTESNKKSRCTFCSSPNYGKGCRFGPHGTHLHVDNPTKCSYCGSPNYGKGCKLNPTGDLHVRGAIYNNMYKEKMQSHLDNSVLLNELKKPYSSFACFKLGIIDEFGNKIKAPITEEEEMSYTPFVKTIIKIKRYLGSKLDLIDAKNLLEAKTIPITEDVVKYKKVIEYQDKANSIINDLYRVVDEALQDGLCLEDIKKIIQA